MKTSVAAWMTRDVTNLPASASVADAREAMAAARHRLVFIVTDDGRLMGVIADDDLRRAFPFVQPGEAIDELVELAETIRVEQVMSRSQASIAPDASLDRATLLMMLTRVNALPVVDHDLLVGVLSRADLLRALAARVGHELPPEALLIAAEAA